MLDYKGASILFSTKCNMNCSYCYIPKSSYLEKVNRELRVTLQEGKVAESITSVAEPEQIETFSLWGAEPTINSELSETVFKTVFEKFPYINQIDMSTNALAGSEPVLTIIKNADKYASLLKEPKKLGFRLQISLDGPEWLTDKNRHRGATQRAVETYKNVVAYTKEHGFKNLRLEIAFKPTVPIETMKEMNEDPAKFQEWYQFFDDLVEYYKGFKNKSLLPVKAPTPTVVTPGHYTSEDGKIFAQWIRNIRTHVDKSKLKNYKGLLFTQPYKSLVRFIEMNRDVIGRFRELTCGGGNATLAFGYQNDLHPCHRNFELNSYVENLDDKLKILAKSHIADCDNKVEVYRLMYKFRGYHDFLNWPITFIQYAVKTLALCGQADELFLHDDKACVLLAIMVLSTTCFLDASKDTREISVPSLSMIRLYANGAFQELMKQLIEFWRERRGL